jgi:Mg2+ and Co2+ transporter CorA
MYRNDLLFVEMILLICMLSLTVGSFVTSSLGMNLNTGFLINNPLIFWVIAGVLTSLLISLTLYLMFRYRLTGSISATIVKE